MILHAGLRNVAVGRDTYQYFQLFEDVKLSSWTSVYNDLLNYYRFGIGKDIGYLFFEKTIQIFTNEFQLFLFVVAIIFFSALGNFIYRNTTKLNDAVLAFLIYFVMYFTTFSTSTIRQSLSTAAALYGYELIKKRKLFKFIILILFASLIHKSVLIFLPFYFISNLKKEKIFLLFTLLIFPVVFIYRVSLGDYFMIATGYEEYYQFDGAGAYNFTAFFVLISIIALFRRKLIIKNNFRARAYFFAFGLVLILLPLSWIHPAALRITMYFSLFMLLLIPEILTSYNNVSPMFRRNIFIYTIIFFIFLFIQSNWDNPSIYGFFWEEMELGNNYN
jgi:transmembrane protein EpsG